jgi:hypothetical protein
VIAATALGCAAAGLLLLFVGLSIYVGSQVGDIWSPGPQSGRVGDADLRMDYDRVPLVTTTQIAAVYPGVPAKEAFRLLGGHQPKGLVPNKNRHGRWVNDHWVRTSISYDYPIAGTGHLYHGYDAADELEITISDRSHTVTKISRIPWREVGKDTEAFWSR